MLQIDFKYAYFFEKKIYELLSGMLHDYLVLSVDYVLPKRSTEVLLSTEKFLPFDSYWLLVILWIIYLESHALFFFNFRGYYTYNCLLLLVFYFY